MIETDTIPALIGLIGNRNETDRRIKKTVHNSELGLSKDSSIFVMYAENIPRA
jgi:hypothetical protein